MKALVLTYDKYHLFAHHMILKYNALWPAHPFDFIVPYNETISPVLKSNENTTFLKTDSHIKKCALQLLEGIPDDEWVYWCIDDKYPIHLVTDALKASADFVENCSDTSISGLCFSRSRGLKLNRLIDQQQTLRVAPKIKAIKRLRYNQIWYHQFLRAKVLRHMFDSFPDESFKAKQMDYYIDDLEMPSDHNLFVTEYNYTTYGETTEAGKLTKNCAKSLVENGLTVPESFDVLDDETIIGDNPHEIKSRIKRTRIGACAWRALRGAE